MKWLISITLLLSFFSLKAQELTVDNKEVLTSELIDGPIVIVSLAPDCPISLKYLNTLKQISSDYSDSLKFIGLFPKIYDLNQVSKFKSDYQLKFDIIIDDNNELIKKYDIKVTPEVVVFNNGYIIYQGAIDNWFYALGKNRIEPNEFYLKNAIRSILNKQVIRINKTEAIGCIIAN